MSASLMQRLVRESRKCALAYGTGHRPRELRRVAHHIQPQTCGGKTVEENLAVLCDDCHYATHAIMSRLKSTGGLQLAIRGMGTRRQRKLALQGYAACVAAGTVDKIPNEGGDHEAAA